MSAAQRYCNTQKADLVSIHSDLENNFISFQVNKKKQRFWIGAQRKTNRSAEWLWTWTDGSSFDYENFFPGKPETHGGIQDCLDIGYNVRDSWDDQPCGHQLPFVCKKQAERMTGDMLNGCYFLTDRFPFSLIVGVSRVGLSLEHWTVC